jgi:hypothetical protein
MIPVYTEKKRKQNKTKKPSWLPMQIPRSHLLTIYQLGIRDCGFESLNPTIELNKCSKYVFANVNSSVYLMVNMMHLLRLCQV